MELFEVLKNYAAGRLIVAVAGAPASGKSTFAAQLVNDLNLHKNGCAALVPLDGFHYDDEVLKSRGLAEIKGAPQTFDVGGLKQLVMRLKRNEDAEIAVPLFDHKLEVSRAAARIVEQQVEIVIVEGNYLLLNDAVWQDIMPFYDVTVFIEIKREMLKQRLIQRWQALNYDFAEIERKVNENDLPNADLVMNNSVKADYII